MKFVKKLSVILVLMITTTLVGCGGNTPSNVVSEYFNKVKKGNANVQELFNIIEEDNQEILEEDKLSKELSDKLLKSMKKLTYKINSEEVNGDSAIVNVTVNSMDLGEVFAKVIQESFSYALAQAFSGMEMSDEEGEMYINDLFVKYLDEVSYSEKTDNILLNKIDGKWKIDKNESLTKLVMGIDSSVFESFE